MATPVQELAVREPALYLDYARESGIVHLVSRVGRGRPLEYLSDGVDEAEYFGDLIFRVTQANGGPLVLFYGNAEPAYQTPVLATQQLRGFGRWRVTPDAARPIKGFRTESHRVKRLLRAAEVPVNEALHIVETRQEIFAEQARLSHLNGKCSPQGDWLILYSPWSPQQWARVHRTVVYNGSSDHSLLEFGNTLMEIVFGRGANVEYAYARDNTRREALAWAKHNLSYKIDWRPGHWSWVGPLGATEPTAFSAPLSHFRAHEESRAFGYLILRFGPHLFAGVHAAYPRASWSQAIRDPFHAWQILRRDTRITQIQSDSGVLCKVQIDKVPNAQSRIFTANWRSVWPEDAGKSIDEFQADNRWARAFRLLEVPGALNFALDSTEWIERQQNRKTVRPYRVVVGVRLNERRIWESVTADGKCEEIGKRSMWEQTPFPHLSERTVAILTPGGHDLHGAEILAAVDIGKEVICIRPQAGTQSASEASGLLFRRQLLWFNRNYTLVCRTRSGELILVGTTYGGQVAHSMRDTKMYSFVPFNEDGRRYHVKALGDSFEVAVTLE